MRAGIIDSHCDALLKLWEQPERNYVNSPDIDANLERLLAGNVRIQLFAIFVEPFIKQDQKFQVVLEQIDIFFEKVLKASPKIKHIKRWSDLNELKDHELGAILTLEGVDAIGDDVTKLSILHQLGVLSVGLTWNQANLCADGVGEARGAGLSTLGKEVVRLNNRNNVLTDVSHLSIKGFWDVMELAICPIASHSNARQICDHPRNLYNDQISELIKKDGYIGLVFCPDFVTTGSATIKDLLLHVDHMCSLGGERHIGFGSDFDGISEYIDRLEHSGQYQNLVEELDKHYSTEQVQRFLYGNFKQLTKRIV
ncbi:dipeptidase [Alkalihalobacillus sp. MEB130]|uniref:dipeptidase n=1 Tax=Alkalihalobacillus sp. MEB130 TaxID=2976704 RepID=UPI0028DF7DCE|nr:dipeptidase [Alkalihalobacillus sp. MEB130]MDT8860590.1 dipeptidase [Alkalihalobacillus sp. MEB130]